MKPNKMPKDLQKMVGTKQLISGGVFSGNKSLKLMEYDVLDIRWGSATVIDMKTFKDKHPTFELLLKRKSMKKAMWSRGFPYRKINLKTK